MKVITYTCDECGATFGKGDDGHVVEVLDGDAGFVERHFCADCRREVSMMVGTWLARAHRISVGKADGR